MSQLGLDTWDGGASGPCIAILLFLFLLLPLLPLLLLLLLFLPFLFPALPLLLLLFLLPLLTTPDPGFAPLFLWSPFRVSPLSRRLWECSFPASRSFPSPRGHPSAEGRGLEQPGGVFPAPGPAVWDLIPVFSIPGTDIPAVEVALEDNLVRHRGAPAPSQTWPSPFPPHPSLPGFSSPTNPPGTVLPHPAAPSSRFPLGIP